MPGVDLVDDLQVPGEYAFEHAHRPALQGLGEEGVVGVSKGVNTHLPCLFPAQLLVVHQDAHELRDGEGGVSVIQLDGSLGIIRTIRMIL